jgi:hypothetical protein
MKAISMILLTIFLGKSCSNQAQNDMANSTIQYTATTRGFYQRIIINNQKATISRDRDEKETPIKVTISDSDWKELVGYSGPTHLGKKKSRFVHPVVPPPSCMCV